jgi:hypothetical protein
MHVGFKVQVEWGTCGLKINGDVSWKSLMNSTKLRYSHIFQTTIVLINFLHMRHMNLMFDVIGDQNFDPLTHG